MEIVMNPPREEWNKLVQRPGVNLKKVRKIVKPIMKKVERNGDSALLKFALEFDLVHLDDLQVSAKEIKAAADEVEDELKQAIEQALHNIELFHKAQQVPPLSLEVMPGVRCMRKSVPIERVGLYVPGGTAPLFSTVLMLGIPARIAGCREVVLCTPPNRSGRVHPAILYTASLLGISKIYKTGGAQAIAAMMYGTETIPRVDKIFGPGNQYVTAAKLVAAQKGIAIDMPAGPSEVAILADASANPAFIAADLLSQAEHGADSQVLLVTADLELAQAVNDELSKQLEDLPRAKMAEAALAASRVVILKKQKDAMEFLNLYAAEHLILAVKNASEVAEMVINAGSVFLGHYTPESVGDYASGTNHTLPTSGFARAYSGVSLDSFLKKITFQELSPEGIVRLGPVVQAMAEAEHLHAHAHAVTVRLNALTENV
ncbi:histidinol dehydrogenase [Cesiribacter andamanensis]|uniref:Histidinol dehydrogenase n=1 Tax=Cesiribacter andamanensis AMV16 TaxID=1279009 RepID=M7N8C5_9BACT|nr:histidinol dehydrogenase [Cesiribacter andamanensis]EMR04838.1 Histidinol dehydrogenase [Cesiribacter andamanensis AMV16]